MQTTTKSDYKRVTKDFPMKKGKIGMVATKPLTMLVPLLFKDKELWSTGKTISTLGNAIIVNDKLEYRLLLIPTMIKTAPSEVGYVEIDNEVYIEMHYEAGDILWYNETELLNVYIYSIFDLYIIQGKIPFYMTGEDILDLMNNLKYHTGSDIVDNSLSMEVILSIIELGKGDKPYRITGGEMDMIGMKDMDKAVTNNLAKITGAYMKQGVTSALTNSNKEAAPVEVAVRS